MIDMAAKQIIPAVMQYTGTLAGIVNSVKEAGGDIYVSSKALGDCGVLLRKTSDALDRLREVEKMAACVPEGRERAVYYHDKVMPAMQDLRDPVDKLEMIVDKTAWPMPSYGDLLFMV